MKINVSSIAHSKFPFAIINWFISCVSCHGLEGTNDWHSTMGTSHRRLFPNLGAYDQLRVVCGHPCDIHREMGCWCPCHGGRSVYKRWCWPTPQVGWKGNHEPSLFLLSNKINLPCQAELHKTERAYHWTMVPSKPNDKVSVTTAVNKTKQIINMYAGTYSTKKPPTFEPVMLYKNIR